MTVCISYQVTAVSLPPSKSPLFQSLSVDHPYQKHTGKEIQRNIGKLTHYKATTVLPSSTWNLCTSPLPILNLQIKTIPNPHFYPTWSTCTTYNPKHLSLFPEEDTNSPPPFLKFGMVFFFWIPNMLLLTPFSLNAQDQSLHWVKVMTFFACWFSGMKSSKWPGGSFSFQEDSFFCPLMEGLFLLEPRLLDQQGLELWG